MDQVDMVVVGSEAVVESGGEYVSIADEVKRRMNHGFSLQRLDTGLINAVGSNQMAIIAKSANVPFYALAER